MRLFDMTLAKMLMQKVTPMRNWTTVSAPVKVSRTSSYHLKAIEILEKLDTPLTSEQIIEAMGWPEGTTQKRLAYLLTNKFVKRTKQRITGKNSRYVYSVA